HGLRGYAPEEVALVLVRIEATTEANVPVGIHLRACVVASGDQVGAEPASAAQQVRDLRVRVAADARVGSPARGVLTDEVVDHVRGELRLHVEDVVGDSERTGDTAGIHDAVQSAARLAGGVRIRVAEGLHRDADDVVALLDEQRGGDG